MSLRPVTVIAMGFLAACAHLPRYVDGQVETAELRYALAMPGPGWEERRDKASDLRFYHARMGASLYVSSTCRGFQDAPLSVLSNHLMFGMDEVDVRQQRMMQLDGRDALERQSLARLDGQEMGVATTVLKKNACIVDFVLLAPPGAFDPLMPEYREWVGSFALDLR